MKSRSRQQRFTRWKKVKFPIFSAINPDVITAILVHIYCEFYGNWQEIVAIAPSKFVVDAVVQHQASEPTFPASSSNGLSLCRF